MHAHLQLLDTFMHILNFFLKKKQKISSKTYLKIFTTFIALNKETWSMSIDNCQTLATNIADTEDCI